MRTIKPADNTLILFISLSPFLLVVNLPHPRGAVYKKDVFFEVAQTFMLVESGTV